MTKITPMKNLPLMIIATGLAMALLSSCSTLPKYGTANQLGTSTPFPLLPREDHVTQATWLSADYRNNDGFAWQDFEKSDAASLRTGGSVTGRWLFAHARLSASTGQYTVREIETYRGKYNFGEIGTSTALGMNFDLGAVEFRPFGLTWGLSQEFGHYKKFRDNAQEDNLIENQSESGLSGHFGAESSLLYHKGPWCIGFTYAGARNGLNGLWSRTLTLARGRIYGQVIYSTFHNSVSRGQVQNWQLAFGYFLSRK